MTKFSQGDIAIVTDNGREGIIVRIENWRGGRVAPYVVRILKSNSPNYPEGSISYFSGRDMELKEVKNKKKVYCCDSNCTTYSFVDKGVIQWSCYKHCTYELPDCDNECISLEEKIDIILEHLGLEFVTEPQKTKLVKREQKDGEETTH